MKLACTSWLFALAMMVSLPVSAQSPWVGPLTPTEPTTSDRISLQFMVSTSPYNLCDLMLPGEVSVSRQGASIHVEYTLRERTEDDPPPPDLCVSTYVPVDVTANLGYLSPGDYVATISTTVAGARVTYPAEYSVAFTVRGFLLSPDVIPPEPSNTDSVKLLITDGTPDNFCTVQMQEPVSVVRNGRSIWVNYAYRSVDPSELAPDAACTSAYFPAYFWVELGQLAAGLYEVTVNGSLDGDPRATQQGSFTVLGGPIDDPVYIPINAPLALSLMLLALGGVAVWRLRVR